MKGTSDFKQGRVILTIEPRPLYKLCRFRTFFEGDWKLQKKTAAIIDGSSSGVDNPKEIDDTSEDDEEDIFGALPSDSDGEDGEITFQVAFYSLRSDNLTNALVGKYYEEEYINAESFSTF